MALPTSWIRGYERIITVPTVFEGTGDTSNVFTILKPQPLVPKALRDQFSGYFGMVKWKARRAVVPFHDPL